MYNNHAGAAFASRRAVIGNYRVCVFFIRGYPPGARTKPAPFLNSHANFMDLRRRKMIVVGVEMQVKKLPTRAGVAGQTSAWAALPGERDMLARERGADLSRRD